MNQLEWFLIRAGYEMYINFQTLMAQELSDLSETKQIKNIQKKPILAGIWCENDIIVTPICKIF